MALDDAGLDSSLNALFTSGGVMGPQAKASLASDLKAYAASAQLAVPGAGLFAPDGSPVTGTAAVAMAFDGSALDAGLDALFAQNNSRPQAAILLASAIQAYAHTATATVTPPPGTLMGDFGPVTGTATAGSPTFDDAGLASAIASIFAQDNSAAFAAAALSASVKNYFKSGRLPVPALGLTSLTALGAPAPVTGQATGAIA